MKARMLVTGLLLGALSAFFSIAVSWVLEDRKQVTFEMQGEVTSFQIERDLQDSSKSWQSGVSDLEGFLNSRGLSVAIASDGLGFPEISVYDPSGNLPWLRGVDYSANMDTILLFKDTYSDQEWRRNRDTPLIPEGSHVAGVVVAPAGAGTLQYVRILGVTPPSPGTGVVNTTDADDLRQLALLLSASGIAMSGYRTLPLTAYLLHDPLLGLTSALLLSGTACGTAFWVISMRGRAVEFQIRRFYGAWRGRLVRDGLGTGLPLMSGGVMIGVAMAGLVLLVVGRAGLDDSQRWALASGGVLGVCVTSVVLAIALAGTLRGRLKEGAGVE